MTTPIEASRAALDQYTAAENLARAHYLAAVSEASNTLQSMLPKVDDRLPVYIGHTNDLGFLRNTDLHKLAVCADVKFRWVTHGCNGSYTPFHNHTDNLPVFAYFPGDDHIEHASAFLKRLAALMTPPAPVAEVVGTLGDLTPNQVRAYAERGGVEFVNRRGKTLARGSMWVVGSSARDVRNEGFPDFAWAYRVWSEGVSVDEPIEFTPRKTNPA